MTATADIHVIKLGGSLLDLPDVVARFARYRRQHTGPCALLVVGGGAAADAVRALDRRLHLGEETAHWLAVRAMQINAHALAAVLPGCPGCPGCRLVDDASACSAAWDAGELAVLDPLPWLMEEARRGVNIPHRWSFTSDSIAAHVAVGLGASRLTLLKSALPADACDAQAAAKLGLVDADFPRVSQGIACVELVNLRDQHSHGSTVDYRATISSSTRRAAHGDDVRT